ncbi:MAG TPA: DUF362 domain-containing protein [Candidatus Nanoarchaeia archaeon]|nr:DUF362 domain-containing protein [Candidatus Nanoarchaeia archaeon]
MVKGVAVKFNSYKETIPAVLDLIKLPQELKKYSKIILKPSINTQTGKATPKEALEAVLAYCVYHKNPAAEIFIAEGADGQNTQELFEHYQYTQLAELFPVGLIDLNEAETEEIQDGYFQKFASIHYPKVLLESFVISIPELSEDPETEIQTSLSNMLGAFPSSKYRGFFSRSKTKLRAWPIKYSIHDIVRCKTPNLAIIDASAQGKIIIGHPLEADKQAAKLLNKDWRSIAHLRLIDDSIAATAKPQKEVEMPEVEQ